MNTTVDFSPFFTTKSQATDFVTRLSQISQKIYQTPFSLEKELMDQLGIQKKDKFYTLLRDSKINAESASALKEFVDSLITYINALPVLSLTFAFEPKEQTLTRMSEWFSLNTKTQILFDISVDSTIMGGAKISYNGKFLDYSIRPKVDELLHALTAPTSPGKTVAQTASPTPTLAILAGTTGVVNGQQAHHSVEDMHG